jgi:RNA polymerase sigma factor (sigma-70 family)
LPRLNQEKDGCTATRTTLSRNTDSQRQILSGADVLTNASGTVDRRQQGRSLRLKEAKLQQLAQEKNKEEFFNELVPLLKPLQFYITRRLRIAYLNQQITRPLASSGDILDRVILNAYENYSHKPEDLALEPWLYQIANRELRSYLSNEQSWEKRSASLERLSRAESRSLEEMPITADIEGEPWLPEDLDDSEIVPREFNAPVNHNDPETLLERKEDLQEIFDALSRIPERERMVFELVAVEGFSDDAAAKILRLRRNEIAKLLESAKKRLREYLQQSARPGRTARRRAS